MAVDVDKKVLLYSGGLDSFILRYTYHFDEVVYFDVGTEDSKREMERFDRRVTIVEFPLKQFELANKIIPFRNYLFTMLAANFGNRISIGATLGDTTRDKDRVFQSLCGAMLNYFGSVDAKMPYKATYFEVEMPFKNLTKAEIVRDWLKAYGGKKELLKDSRSCYKGGIVECGKCRACLRKYVAFKNNDIEDLLDFTVTQGQLVHLYEESVTKQRHPKELQEIVQCYSDKTKEKK